MKNSINVALTLPGLTFLLAATVPLKSAPEPSAALKEELVQLETQSWEAWKNHDGKFFEGFLSDDHVEVGFGGLTSKTEVVAGVASGVCEVKKYSLDHLELKMLGDDMALLTYYEAQETSCQGKAVPSPCWVSSLYRKRGERWLNVLYQQTPAAKYGKAESAAPLSVSGTARYGRATPRRCRV